MSRMVRCIGLFIALATAFWLISPALSQEKAQEPVTKFFQTGDAKIKVWAYAPAKPGTYPGIVLLHGIEGLSGSDELKPYGEFCQKIAAFGYVVHLVHYMDATNQKGQNVLQLETAIKDTVLGKANKEDEAKARALYATWMTVARDAVGNIRKADKEADKKVDGKKIVVVGCSLGGFLGLSLACQEPDLKLGALIQLFGGLPKEHYAKVTKALPPILIIHSEKDQIVSCKDCCNPLVARLKEMECNHETLIYEASKNVPHMFIVTNEKMPNEKTLHPAATGALFKALGFLGAQLNDAGKK